MPNKPRIVRTVEPINLDELWDKFELAEQVRRFIRARKPVRNYNWSEVMKKKYRIEFRRSGHLYQPVYAQTIAGAVKAARKQGWYEDGKRESNWDGRPSSALISERVGANWELVATVTEKGIEAEDCTSRRSYKQAEIRLAEAKAYIEHTHAVMMAFNYIVDKEYAAETKK